MAGCLFGSSLILASSPHFMSAFEVKHGGTRFAHTAKFFDASPSTLPQPTVHSSFKVQTGSRMVETRVSGVHLDGISRTQLLYPSLSPDMAVEKHSERRFCCCCTTSGSAMLQIVAFLASFGFSSAFRTEDTVAVKRLCR